ncbi:MAG: hypothetical protein V9E82_04705 [Candidatus Nanopelagicales bacterium]
MRTRHAEPLDGSLDVLVHVRAGVGADDREQRRLHFGGARERRRVEAGLECFGAHRVARVHGGEHVLGDHDGQLAQHPVAGQPGVPHADRRTPGGRRVVVQDLATPNWRSSRIAEEGLSSTDKKSAALAEFLAELESDPFGMVDAVAEFSYAFSATVQQSVDGKCNAGRASPPLRTTRSWSMSTSSSTRRFGVFASGLDDPDGAGKEDHPCR